MYLHRRIIKYFYLKFKWKRKLSFSFNNIIGIKSIFEGDNKIDSNSYFDGYMGKGSYIGANSHIEGYIGRYTSIAPHCHVVQGKHPYTYPYASTSPLFYAKKTLVGISYTKENKFEELSYAIDNYAVKIGNDCWIGFGASIIAGVTINDGAVVLAHAVVTKDVPPYAIVAGIPAKIIKYRYNEKDIAFLLEKKWWNKPNTWIKKNSIFFSDINKLKNIL